MILKKSIYESVIMKGLPGFWGREIDLQFGFKGVKRFLRSHNLFPPFHREIPLQVKAA